MQKSVKKVGVALLGAEQALAASDTMFVYLLDTSSGWCALPCGFGGQLLTRGLATSGFTGSLLCSSHGCCCNKLCEQKAR